MIGFINTNSVTSLIIAAVILGAIAVIVDRLNFPQKPFRPRGSKPVVGASRHGTEPELTSSTSAATRANRSTTFAPSRFQWAKYSKSPRHQR